MKLILTAPNSERIEMSPVHESSSGIRKFMFDVDYKYRSRSPGGFFTAESSEISHVEDTFAHRLVSLFEIKATKNMQDYADSSGIQDELSVRSVVKNNA